MISLENLLKNFIADAIVLAYEKIQDGNKEIAPADGLAEGVNENPAPSSKRTRRTKAEIEAAKQVEEAVKPPVKAFEYDTLKEAVFNYVLENGKPAAEKLLGQFGVSRAQDLQPEQWEEAYSLFSSVAEESIA